MRSDKDRQTYYLVIARDSDYYGQPRCVNCGAVADDVHEILPKSYFGKNSEDVLFDIKNRCCLCRDCHSVLHNDRGRAKLLGSLKGKYNYEYEGRAKCLLEEYKADQ